MFYRSSLNLAYLENNPQIKGLFEWFTLFQECPTNLIIGLKVARTKKLLKSLFSNFLFTSCLKQTTKQTLNEQTFNLNSLI